MAQAIKEWILEEVESYTSTETTGTQNSQGEVWTSKNRIKQSGSGESTPYSSANIQTAIEKLVEEGELVEWSGLIAPGNKEHIRAIIRNEAQASAPRSILVGKMNAHIQDLNESEEAEGSEEDGEDTDEED